MRPERIPLFPLNVVLLPGAELPLHIFEPRYREMVKTCIEEKSETEDPLLHGQVDYLDDRENPGDPRVQRQLVELFEACHTLIFDDYPKNLEGASTEELSYLVAATLPMDLLWKQRILELRTEADRQERLVAYLREWAPHLQNKGALRQRAGGNGHGLH